MSKYIRVNGKLYKASDNYRLVGDAADLKTVIARLEKYGHSSQWDYDLEDYMRYFLNDAQARAKLKDLISKVNAYQQKLLDSAKVIKDVVIAYTRIDYEFQSFKKLHNLE